MSGDIQEGRYNDERRWISREDFEELKDKDPYVAFIWSFGNNLRDYMYGKEVEPFKKALHYAILFKDYSLMKELGFDLSFIDPIVGDMERYKAVKDYFKKGAKSPFCDVPSRVWELANNERRAALGDTNESIGVVLLENLQRTQRLVEIATSGKTYQRTNSFGGGNLTLQNISYQDVEIKPNSVIYCDIPYINTNVYDTENGFDHEAFYDWCERQTEPVFISEYWMPEDRFKCIQEFKHTSNMDANSVKQVVEKVFIPINQELKGNIQLSLFD